MPKVRCNGISSRIFQFTDIPPDQLTPTSLPNKSRLLRRRYGPKRINQPMFLGSSWLKTNHEHAQLLRSEVLHAELQRLNSLLQPEILRSRAAHLLSAVFRCRT